MRVSCVMTSAPDLDLPDLTVTGVEMNVIMLLYARGLISEKPCMLLVNTVITYLMYMCCAIIFFIFRD